MTKHKLIIYFLILMIAVLNSDIYANQKNIKGVHLLVHNFDELKIALDKISGLGVNTVILNNKYFFQLDDKRYKKKMVEIFNYARGLNINLIPELQSFGAAENILQIYPQAAEALRAKDKEFEFFDDAVIPIDDTAVKIANHGFEQGKAGWEFGKDWIIDKDAYAGKNSAKIGFTSNLKKHSEILRSPEYKAEPNTVYSLQCYAKAKVKSGNPPAIRVVELNKYSKWITQHDLKIDNQDWQYKELNFKTTEECYKVYIYANIWEGSGSAWFDDIRILNLDSALVNVIINDNVEIKICDAQTNEVFELGKDYKIIENNLAFPYLANANPLKIMRTKNSRIANGQRVKISYDYAAGMVPYAGWSIPYCPFEPKTYEIMAEAINNVVDILNPEFIAFGHDEVRGLNRDSRCRSRNLSNAQVLAYDVNTLYRILKETGSQARIIIWDDMFNPWHNAKEDYQLNFAGIKGGTKAALDDIPKDIIFLIWWGDKKDWLGKMKNSPDFFEKKGFDYFVVGSNTSANLKAWADLVEGREKCLGIFATTWDGLENNLKVIKFLAEELQAIMLKKKL